MSNDVGSAMTFKNDSITRREFHQAIGGATAGILASHALAGDAANAPGAIRGEPTADKVGLQMLAAGGNAIDAIVAAALTATVVVPHQTGIGGYGGAVTLAVDGGRRITSIDFNTMAPAAMKPDIFPVDAAGKVIGDKHRVGWLAAGVPGILAGLQLTLDKYGTKSFREVVQPAIALARNGFPFGDAGVSLRSSAKLVAEDAGSHALYFRDGEPLTPTDHYSNLDLSRLLEQLAKDNSVDSFYRGDIAKQIAAAFAKNGGLVTVDDMAAYRAREVEPITMNWDDWTVHTAPLAAGGATIIEALLLLKELKWAEREPGNIDAVNLQVEALRYAWQDRFELLGDPEHADVPLRRLLETATIRSAAAKIEKAVVAKQPLPVRVTSRPDQGTINLSAADKGGNLAALTLTHGDSFGAKITVPGLGLTLGHGMSRFDPKPNHPNAPGSHKRPLHNMCPTVVSQNGRARFAVGARGGRKIPNVVFQVVLQLAARGTTLADAVVSPRMHTEGTLAVSFEKTWPAEIVDAMKSRGYTVTTIPSATISAAGMQNGEPIAAMR
jgi:gamma-glutamyltranspeptidase/glutathione hydrolase